MYSLDRFSYLGLYLLHLIKLCTNPKPCPCPPATHAHHGQSRKNLRKNLKHTERKTDPKSRYFAMFESTFEKGLIQLSVELI